MLKAQVNRVNRLRHCRNEPFLRSTRDVHAFCLSCPHELCDVVLKEDTGLFPCPEGAKKREHPLFVCPCHFSVFDPVANGAHLTGPAGQALFRFRLRLSSRRVAIDAVEKAALR